MFAHIFYIYKSLTHCDYLNIQHNKATATSQRQCTSKNLSSYVSVSLLHLGM